jgi:hypothetical protein
VTRFRCTRSSHAKSRSAASSVTRAGVELSSIRQKTRPRNKYLTKKPLAEQVGYVGLVVHYQDADTHDAASALARCARGKRIVNSVNSPGTLSTAIVPACCWVTMSQAIDSPRPVPSPAGFVVTKVEQFVPDLGRDPGAVVAHPHFDRRAEIRLQES